MALQPEHIILGKKGERLARFHLLNQGYILIEKNYFDRKLEVDIIAEKDQEIVFVEVKTRRYRGDYGPEEAVDKTKQNNLEKVAERFMLKHQLANPYRIDIIAITWCNLSLDINHIKDAGNTWDYASELQTWEN